MWRADVRQDPGRLWRGPVPRLAGLVLLGVVAVLGIQWLISGLAAATGSPTAGIAAPRATLYVACTNPACRAHYTTQQPTDFKAWPLTCEKCGAKLVYRAVLCPTCHHWYAVVPGTSLACPFCAEKKTAAESKSPTSNPQESRDYAEDPW